MKHADIQTLASRVEGPVLLPGDEGYDEERTGANLAVRHEPEVIVGAARAEDVQEAVRFAAEHGLAVAVQCTGHGYAAAARGGLLVTTGRMAGVEVDPDQRTVTVEAGVRFEQVIPAAAPYGLAPLNGSAPHVGVVSYVLGGGVGLLVRTFGYAADRVRRLELVTADGELRTVTADGDPDLYWAVVGGRDNFGIVTRLEMDLVPVDRVYGGGFFYDAEAAPGVLTAYVRWAEGMPREMNSSVALIPMPDDPEVPEPMRGRHVYHVRIAYTGGAEEGERLVAPLREAGPVLMEALRDMPYTESASIHDEPPAPVPFQRETTLLREVGDDVVRTLLEHAGPQAPVPCVVELRHLGGAVSAPPERPNSVAHRDAPYLLSVVTLLFGITAEDTRPLYEKLFHALGPFSSGATLNFLGFGANAGEDRVRAAYAPADLERLARLKAVHDPQNLFRLNYNVPPAASDAPPAH
ncbi:MULTISPECIES: FAD-binding oxidoreductase [Streptomyces]|uniref:FAD-binding protein n=2 Tax=Streptomyces TaxID=1883 RepID=A0A100Y8F4_9ACTN|nr:MULTISPECIES: FAD-binding oxidoreductase [Streptomyces]KUH39564.1 FAD-binding protein [Streptomyces kanasensis]UUS34107.1 FAD-binding oxidoreductase [Streptomyces changanensis]